MASVRRIQFVVDIKASPASVHALIIGSESYRVWTAPFAEGSHFEGSWNAGERIRFLGPSGDGMLAEIAEHRPGEFVSIRHLGFIRGGVEDTESESVRTWLPAYENYTLTPIAEGTRLVVDQDMAEDYMDYMQKAWPRALEVLKSLAENRSI